MLSGLPFSAGLLPLLVTDLPLGPLVTEDLDLAVGAVDGLVAAVVVAVGVDLQVQGKTLHAFLRGEVCAQAVDRDEDLHRTKKRRRHKLSREQRENVRMKMSECYHINEQCEMTATLSTSLWGFLTNTKFCKHFWNGCLIHCSLLPSIGKLGA